MLITGALVIAFPGEIVSASVRTVGLLAVYLAPTELVHFVGWSAHGAAADTGAEQPRRQSPLHFHVRPLAIAALIGLALIGGVTLYTNRDALRSPAYVSAAEIHICNGFKERCNRRL